MLRLGRGGREQRDPEGAAEPGARHCRATRSDEAQSLNVLFLHGP